MPPRDEHYDAFLSEHRELWDRVARESDGPVGRASAYYHKRLLRTYRHVVPEGLRVLELGCGEGDLLAGLRPAYGVGVDISPEMAAKAAERHPGLDIRVQDAHQLDVDGPFDCIILSDLVNELWDVQEVLEGLHRVCTPRTRIILNFFSHLWAKPLELAQRLGWARPQLEQNWLTVHDAENLLALAGFDPIRAWDDILCPVPVPLLADWSNRYLAKIAPFRWLDLTHFLLARPAPGPRGEEKTVSVVVAARNEEGNVPDIFRRVPQMGAGTELIVVEGGSSDDTWGAVERTMGAYPELKPQLLRQPGKGKGDAVRTGFDAATGDVLMILDADLTVPPEDLPRFYDALMDGHGEFINGVRLVYPMQSRAMRLANLVGNKFFSAAFSWLLGQPIKDTLCGTKVLTRDNYRRIADNRHYFGDFDPFGDFDLLFGAAKGSLKIVDMPIRYRDRLYGDTNIQRWRHGMILLRMVAFAARRIKFI